jgi:hypothetical protein
MQVNVQLWQQLQQNVIQDMFYRVVNV